MSAQPAPAALLTLVEPRRDDGARPPSPRPPALRRGTLNYLEAELRDYRETRREIAEIDGDVCAGGMAVAYDAQRGARTGPAGHSDPTAARATRLATYRLLRQMRLVCGAIEEVVGLLPAEQRRALALLYWRPNSYGTVPRVAEAVHIAPRTLRAWRALWLALLAAKLGLR